MSFIITLKFKKADLVAVMARHGVTNVVIQRGDDVNSIIEFILDAIKVSNIEVATGSLTCVSEDEVEVQLSTGSYQDGWHERVRESLKRLNDYVSER